MSRKDAGAAQAEAQAIRWLARLNSPALTAEEEAEFFSWLESSPVNQAAYIKSEALWQRGEVLARVSDVPPQRFWDVQSWRSWALACSCVLAVVLVLLMNLAGPTEHYSYLTAIGEQQDVLLEDGSRIILNTNSRIDLAFSRDTRMAYLQQGEVFFDVKADRKRPFIIETEFGQVRVVGTRFAVRQSATDTSVTVIDGKVALGSKPVGNHQFESNLMLQANQRSSLQTALAGQAVESVEASSALAWRRKQLIFSGQALQDVIAELGRYFPETIALQDSSLGEREITAVIQLSDIRTTLQALAHSLNLSVEFDPAHPSAFLLAEPQ